MSKQATPYKNILIGIGACLALSGCVSFGNKSEATALLTLTANASVADGTARSGERKDAMVILLPETPRKLDTARIPVQVDASSVAYLKGAVWADKPARLWQELLAETIAARTNRLVLNNFDAGGKEQSQLSGVLLEFGVDAGSNDAVIVFDAVKHIDSKVVEKRRFAIRKTLPAIEAKAAGDALNDAANQLAAEITDWIK
jgi:cholesterol transport system auxiliary component